MRSFVRSMFAATVLVLAALTLPASPAEATHCDCSAQCEAARTASAATVASASAPTTEAANVAIPWSTPSEVDATPMASKCGPGSCTTGSCGGDTCSTCGTTIMTACCEDGNGNCYACNPSRCPPCPKSCY